ncbi:hypothetical protein Ga0102493_112140 [Erythrobacter litoralis]|jgi:hypothetical protein|nr:hypothetical protein Ga0102493_112140 [Erythrobacter litoralis]
MKRSLSGIGVVCIAFLVCVRADAKENEPGNAAGGVSKPPPATTTVSARVLPGERLNWSSAPPGRPYAHETSGRADVSHSRVARRSERNGDREVTFYVDFA